MSDRRASAAARRRSPNALAAGACRSTAASSPTRRTARRERAGAAILDGVALRRRPRPHRRSLGSRPISAKAFQPAAEMVQRAGVAQRADPAFRRMTGDRGAGRAGDVKAALAPVEAGAAEGAAAALLCLKVDAEHRRRRLKPAGVTSPPSASSARKPRAISHRRADRESSGEVVVAHARLAERRVERTGGRRRGGASIAATTLIDSIICATSGEAMRNSGAVPASIAARTCASVRRRRCSLVVCGETPAR